MSKTKHEIENIYPTTPMQNGMLFHYIKEPESKNNFEQFVFQINGDLNVNLLEESFNKLIDRHSTFRTIFNCSDADNFLQIVLRKVDIDLKFEDISDFTSEDIEAYIHNEKIQDRNRGFNLFKERLMRLIILKTNSESYIVIWSSHHIIMDGWCINLVFKEVLEIYTSLRLDRQALLEKLPPYSDFIQWLDKQDKYVSKKYWDNYLMNYVAPASIPKFKKNINNSNDRKNILVEFDELITNGLVELAKKCNVTLNTLFQTLWGILLQKYNQTNDVVFGSVVSGRPSEIPSIEKMIGLFINTVPVRIQSTPEMEFSELVRSVQNSGINSLKHEYFPLYEIQSSTDLKQDLIDHILVFENFPLYEQLNKMNDFESLGFTMKEIDLFEQTSYSFNVIVLPGMKLRIRFNYNVHLYDEKFIEQIYTHLITMSNCVINDPSICIANINIISNTQKKEIVDNFNRTLESFDENKTLHQLFEEQVEIYGDSKAITCNGNSLTYRELDDRSNQLANYLIQERNLGPGVLVGVMMERSINQLVSLMAIIKAGGAYVPIDSSYPVDRIRGIIENAQLSTLISEKKHIRLLNHLQWECANLQAFLCLDSEDVHLEAESDKNIMMDKEVWEYIGEQASDDISAGAWVNSYSRESFTRKEMDEYASNIYAKLMPYIDGKSRVLEIGCASGLSMYKIAPEVGLYYGTDLSQTIINQNQEKVKRNQINNINLYCIPAHEISHLTEMKFDVVIINSVIQNFHGHNYLRDVILQAIGMLSDKGVLFIGDIMDQDSKEIFLESLESFQKENPQFNTKTNFSSELFIARQFFVDLKAEIKEIHNITFTDKQYTVENELTKYRYDAMLHIDKCTLQDVTDMKKVKYQYDYRVVKPHSKNRPNVSVCPTDLAYVIYTSGSTGKPKGVMIEHRSIVNRLQWMQKKYPVSINDITLLKTSFTFDVSVWELFGWGIAGAKAHMLPLGSEKDPEAIVRTIENIGITTIHFVPSMFNMFLEYVKDIDTGRLASLRYIFVSGEELLANLVDTFNDLLAVNGTRLINLYGPTEATVEVSYFECTGKSMQKVPIGRPIQNIKLYILDGAKNIVPVGVTGELYISGIGLARGYLAQTELTAERFFENPFDHGSTIYKTGDKARFLPSGDIEYLGRIDSQVKIRGFRIELDDIRFHILSIPYIVDAVVTIRSNGEINSEIIAYIISKREVETSVIREYLAEKIPQYMLPHHIVFIDEIPLTIAGKVNFSVLSEKTSPKNTEIVRQANNEIQSRLVEAWEKVLGRKNIGITDDFFEMGGDSIKAIQVSSHLRKSDLQLELKDVFEYKTIAKLSMKVKPLSKKNDQSSVKGTAPLTPIQISFFNRENKYPIYYVNQAIVLHHKNGFDELIVRQVLNLLVTNHDSLRVRYRIENGEYIQYIPEESNNLFLLESFDVKEEQLEAGIVDIEAARMQKMIDIHKGPLLVAGVFRSEDGDHLLLSIHHLAVDGVSWRILLEDFSTSYNHILHGKQNLISYKTESYFTWAHYLKQYARSTAIKEEFDYWSNVMSALTPIPKDKETDSYLIKDNDFVEIILSKEETSILQGKANYAFNTQPIDLLLTALGMALSEWTNKEEFVISLEGHGRDAFAGEVNIERTVGWFTAEYPHNIQVKKLWSIAETIKKVKESIRRIPNKGVGFGVINYLMQNNQSHFDGKPDILFNYLGHFGEQEDTSFGSSPYQINNSAHQNATRSHRLLFNLLDNKGHLSIRIDFNKHEYLESTIRKLLNKYIGKLRNITEYCMKQKEKELTSSDFSYINVSSEGLDKLRQELRNLNN